MKFQFDQFNIHMTGAYTDLDYMEFEQTLHNIMNLNLLANALMIGGLLLTTSSFLFIFVLAAGIALKIYLYIKCKGILHYEMDSSATELYERRKDALLSLNKCKKIWQIISAHAVTDGKRNSNASRTIDERKLIRVSVNPPFYMNSNITVPILSLKNETLFFFPDMVLIKKGGKIQKLDYFDLKVSAGTVPFVEDGTVPSDSEIIGKTWKYLNKDGTPDGRFKDNPQRTRCRYGRLIFASSKDLDVELQLSNKTISDDFYKNYMKTV